MPEHPPNRRLSRPLPDVAIRSASPAGARYAELHCRSNFSFLSAASHPDELVARAIELGHTALAITDQNSVAGIVRAHVAAKELGFKLLIGAEITLPYTQQVLKNFIDSQARKVTIESIQKAVAEQFGLRLVEIKAKNNSRAIVYPRKIAM